MSSSVQAEAPAVAEGSLSLLLDVGQGRNLGGFERGRCRVLTSMRRALASLEVAGRVGQHGVCRKRESGWESCRLVVYGCQREPFLGSETRGCRHPISDMIFFFLFFIVILTISKDVHPHDYIVRTSRSASRAGRARAKEPWLCSVSRGGSRSTNSSWSEERPLWAYGADGKTGATLVEGLSEGGV